jgi:hypothetical protein
MALDVRAYLKAAPKRILHETFGQGEYAFDVTILGCTRYEMEAMRSAATTKILDKTTRQFVDTPDLRKIREFLARKCLNGWSQLTGRKLAYWANLEPTGTADDDAIVEFSPEAAIAVMEASNQFENFVFTRATDLADVISVEDAAGKNA